MEIEITKNIYDKMVSQQFVVSIVGMFDQELLLSLIDITDKKLTGMDVQGATKRKIFHFMVECSQNLLKTDLPANTGLRNNIFLIGQDGENYSVYLGSTLSKNKLLPVLKTIEQVNTVEAG